MPSSTAGDIQSGAPLERARFKDLVEQYTEVDPGRAADLRNAVMDRLSPDQQNVLARDLQSPTRSPTDNRETTSA